MSPVRYTVWFVGHWFSFSFLSFFLFIYFCVSFPSCFFLFCFFPKVLDRAVTLDTEVSEVRVVPFSKISFRLKYGHGKFSFLVFIFYFEFFFIFFSFVFFFNWPFRVTAGKAVIFRSFILYLCARHSNRMSFKVGNVQTRIDLCNAFYSRKVSIYFGKSRN